MQQLSPIGWALRPLQNYAKFSGRASRAEFWWFFLFVMIIYVGGMFIGIRSLAAMTPADAANPSNAINFANSGAGVFVSVLGVFWLAVLLPMIAVQVRRLHDINRSGWWLGIFWLLYPVYLILLFGTSATIRPGAPPASYGVGLAIATGVFAVAFFIYSIVLLVFWCLPGTRGDNRYGADPYGASVEEVFA